MPVVLHMDTAEKKFESISGLLPSRRLAFLRELPKKRQICKFSWPQPQSLAENRRKVPRNGRFIFKKEKRDQKQSQAHSVANNGLLQERRDGESWVGKHAGQEARSQEGDS